MSVLQAHVLVRPHQINLDHVRIAGADDAIAAAAYLELQHRSIPLFLRATQEITRMLRVQPATRIENTRLADTLLHSRAEQELVDRYRGEELRSVIQDLAYLARFHEDIRVPHTLSDLKRQTAGRLPRP